MRLPILLTSAVVFWVTVLALHLSATCNGKLGSRLLRISELNFNLHCKNTKTIGWGQRCVNPFWLPLVKRHTLHYLAKAKARCRFWCRSIASCPSRGGEICNRILVQNNCPKIQFGCFNRFNMVHSFPTLTDGRLFGPGPRREPPEIGGFRCSRCRPKPPDLRRPWWVEVSWIELELCRSFYSAS